jgi:hypothetical protein
VKRVLVMVAPDEVEAKVAKALLESSGIPCWLSSDVPPSVYPMTVDGLAETRLYVAEDRAAEARALLECPPGDMP